jgi:O-antigen/teichoic acid export membrane protein
MYDGLYTLVLRILGVGLAAGLTIFTARLLGPAGRGTYALPGVEAALVASVFGGLSSATSYFLLNRKTNRAFFTAVAGCTVLWTALAALALIPLTYFGARWTALPAMEVLPAMAVLNVATGYAIGTRRVRASSTLTVLPSLLTFGAIVAALLIVARDPAAAIRAWIAGTNIAGAAALIYIIADSRKNICGTEAVGFGEFTKFCAKVSAVYVVTLLNYRADLYVVALVLSPAALGMYGIAVTAAESLLLPTQAAALAASPHIASSEVRESGMLTARCVRNNLLIATVTCGLLIVFARPLLQLLYGKAFLPAVPAFVILLLGVLALSTGSPVSTYFTLRLGRPHIALWFGALSAAICLGTTIALIGRMGMTGAAIGSTAGYLAGQAAGLWYFRRGADVGWREMFVPTIGDLRAYASFALRIARDSRRLFQPVP